MPISISNAYSSCTFIIIATVLIALQLPQQCLCLQVDTITNLRKVYPSRRFSLFPKPSGEETIALHPFSLNLTTPILTLIGTSGSGKSTLSKLICGKELPTSGTIHRRSEACGAYIDQHFYMQYDSKSTTYELLSQYKDTLGLASRLHLPNTRIDSLLNTQKRLFEITLALLRTASVEHPLVILDEYLDKDMTPSLQLIKVSLDQLCREMALQVIIVTHSRAVLQVFHDEVIVLNKGRVYSQSFNRKDVNMPAQLQMI